MVCAEKASAAESTRPNFEVAGASQKARPCKPQSSRATAGDRAALSDTTGHAERVGREVDHQLGGAPRLGLPLDAFTSHGAGATAFLGDR